jgi:energy-coupling factor transport system ATP-binding protein
MGIVVEPQLLLLDEPAEGLDEASAGRMTTLLGAARARGTTLVVVSHRGVELAALSARTIHLDGGRLVPARHATATTPGGSP